MRLLLLPVVAPCLAWLAASSQAAAFGGRPQRRVSVLRSQTLLGCTSDSSALRVLSNDGEILTLDTASGKPKSLLSLSPASCVIDALSPNGEFVLVVSNATHKGGIFSCKDGKQTSAHTITLPPRLVKFPRINDRGTICYLFEPGKISSFSTAQGRVLWHYLPRKKVLSGCSQSVRMRSGCSLGFVDSLRLYNAQTGQFVASQEVGLVQTARAPICRV